jgi:hypothetical protein
VVGRWNRKHLSRTLQNVRLATASNLLGNGDLRGVLEQASRHGDWILHRGGKGGLETPATLGLSPVPIREPRGTPSPIRE